MKTTVARLTLLFRWILRTTAALWKEVNWKSLLSTQQNMDKNESIKGETSTFSAWQKICFINEIKSENCWTTSVISHFSHVKDSLPHILQVIVLHTLPWVANAKEISSNYCSDKIWVPPSCWKVQHAGRERAKHRLWCGQGESQRESTGCWQPGMYPSQVQTRQSLPGWASSLCSGAQEMQLQRLHTQHLLSCTYLILTGKPNPKEKLPPNLEGLPFWRMENTISAQQLWTGTSTSPTRAFYYWKVTVR